MSDVLNPFLMIASAIQGGGKSVETVSQFIYQAYLAPVNNRRSGILFDTNNEFAKVDIKGTIHYISSIPLNEIGTFGNRPKKEVRRIAPFHTNGHPMSPEETEALLIKVATEARNVNVLIEDLNTIFGDSLPVKISGLLCNVRHRNAYVTFHIQSVARLLPKILQNCKIIRMHYQLDSVSQSKDKLKDEIDIFSIAEKIINKKHAEGNIRYFVYIYREAKKIKGEFSEKQFFEACKEYVYDTPKTTTQLEKRRDPGGKKVYTYEEAVTIKSHELFHKHYGNPRNK